MQTLWTDDKVAEALAWPAVLQAIEAGFAHKDSFQLPERVIISGPRQSSYLTMPCSDAAGWFGVKQVAVIPENVARGKPTVQAHYTLFDPEGSMAVSAEATLMTRMRTAASSAVAAKYLAPEAAQTLLLVGTGSLAPWMAEAHMQVRDYQQLQWWGRRPEAAQAAVAQLRERLAAAGATIPKITVVEDLAAAVQAADVISVATTAQQPIIRGEWLRAGQHLDLVGAFIPSMAEADPAAVRRARVFVDDLAGAEAEAGDLLQARAQGWTFDQVQGTLGDIVARRAGRHSADDLTLFKSVGVALEDLCTAKLLA